MNDSSIAMWTYWRDKHGIIDALVHQYPDTLATTPALQMALHQIRANEALIDKIMADLADKEDDNE